MPAAPTIRVPLEAREPLGIVIADGGHPEGTTRFSAFVWGPVPEESAGERGRAPRTVSAA